MRIKSTDSTTPLSSVKKAGKAKASGDVSFASHLDGPSEAAEVSSTSAIGNIDSLLSLQADEQGSANSRAKKYGDDVLDSLEKIFFDLLNGGVPVSRLRNLAELMQRQREYAGVDSGMLDIIDEIETRALVELAKYEASLSG